MVCIVLQTQEKDHWETSNIGRKQGMGWDGTGRQKGALENSSQARWIFPPIGQFFLEHFKSMLIDFMNENKGRKYPWLKIGKYWLINLQQVDAGLLRAFKMHLSIGNL